MKTTSSRKGRAAALVLAILALAQSCASFDAAMKQGELAEAETIAKGLKGAERSRAYLALGESYRGNHEILDAYRCFMAAGEPDAALDVLVSYKALFDSRMLALSLDALRALAAEGDREASLSAAREVSVLAGSLRDRRATDADYEGIFAIVGLAGVEADAAVGDAFLKEAERENLDPARRKELLIAAGERYRKSGSQEKARYAIEREGEVALENGEDADAARLLALAGRDAVYIETRLGDRYSRPGLDRDAEKAIEHYRRAGDAGAVARVRFESGMAALAAGKPMEALREFDASGLPDAAWAKEMAAFYEKRGDLPAAADYYAMAGDGAASRAAWRASAERAFAVRDYKMAIERYEKAGDAAGAAAAMVQLGKAAQERKEFPLALEWFAKAGSAKDQLAAHAAWAEAAAAAGKRAEAAEHFRLAGDVAAARAAERALGKELLEQGDYARAYALLSPDGPESAAAALIAAGRAKGAEARVETALVAAGLPEKTVRESIAQAAYEAGDFLVALMYVDKLGDAARSAALLEGAATQALASGRLDELYRIRLRTAKDAKEAQESVVKAGIEAGKIAETRAFLEKAGMKSADAATRIADIAFAQGGWDLAADLYAVAGKKSRSAESYAKASEEAARRGDWEGAASYLVKTGMKRSDADRKLASDAIERGDYPKAIELGLRGGLTELEAASRVADDLFKKQGYPEGYKFLRSHGASEREAAQRAAEAADRAGASAAAAEYYRLAGVPDKAYPYEQRAALAEFAAGRYDEGLAILERGSMDAKKAAEAAGDAAAKNQAAARAVEFYLRAGLPAKAAPFFEKASMEKALEGDLDLAEDYARRSGKKVNLDFVEVLKACRGEMVAYIDAKEGIEPQDFVDYLKTLEKRYGSRIVWETLKNSALYYLKLGADLLTGTDISKIGAAEIAKIDRYSGYSKILSTLYGEMGK